MHVWSSLLQPVTDAGIDAVLTEANLDWEVDLLPMSVDLTDEVGNLVPSTVEGHRCVIRADTSDQLGVVGDRYTCIQNSLAFSLFDVVRKEGQMKFSNAGTFDKGKMVLVLAEMSKPLVIDDDGDDVVVPYMVMFTSHDGSRALGVQVLGTFKKSAGTANITMFGRTDGLAVRHSGLVGDKVKEARRLIAAATTAATGFRETARILSKRYLTYNEVDAILKELIPDPRRKDSSNARAVSRRQSIRTLFEVGDGSDLPTREGTAWGLYVALVTYNSTERPTRGDDAATNRIKSAWFGSSATSNRTALGLLVDRASDGKKT